MYHLWQVEPDCDFNFREIVLHMPLEKKKKEEEKTKQNQHCNVNLTQSS